MKTSGMKTNTVQEGHNLVWSKEEKSGMVSRRTIVRSVRMERAEV